MPGDTHDAAGRALAALRALAATTTPLTLAELASAADMPLRAAHRQIGILDRAGVPIRQTPGWPVRYHVDLVDLVGRWIAGARS